MGPVKRALAHALIVVMAIAAALVAAAPAGAVHGRGFDLSWNATGPSTADVHSFAVLARDQYSGTASDGHPATGDVVLESIGGTQIYYGDGLVTPILFYRVATVDKKQNWFLAEALEPSSKTDVAIGHKYAQPGPWNLEINGCCIIDGVQNNFSAPFSPAIYYVRSRVDLARDKESPVTSVPPLVTIESHGVQSWPIPAVDAGGQRLRWRLPTGDEPRQKLPGTPRIDPNTGVMEWDPNGFEGRNFWAGAVVEALDASGSVVSSSHVTYLVNVIPPGSNRAPE